MRFYSQDDSFRSGSAPDKWLAELRNGLSALGKDSEPDQRLETLITKAGFSKVHHEIYAIPVGGWPKDRALVSLASGRI